MSLDNLNWLAVIVSGVVYFMLGALWYSPLLFAKMFMRYRGMTSEEIQRSGNTSDYALAFVADLVAAFVLALVIKSIGVTDVGAGILTGIVAGVGLSATSTLTYTIFSGPHKGLWAIYSGYQLVAFAVMGAILTLWV